MRGRSILAGLASLATIAAGGVAVVGSWDEKLVPFFEAHIHPFGCSVRSSWCAQEAEGTTSGPSKNPNIRKTSTVAPEQKAEITPPSISAEVIKPLAPIAPTRPETLSRSAAAPSTVARCDALTAAPFDDDARAAGVSGIEFRDMRYRVTEAIEACTTATNANPTDRRLWFQLGRAYDRNQEWEKARRNYQRAAGMGSGAAMVNLGVLYSSDANLGYLPETARKYYAAAADSKNAEGMYLLGNMMRSGVGGPQDSQLARALYRRALLNGMVDPQRARRALAEIE